METRKTPLVLTASALAMALMLVGCGGGSSSSTPQPTVAAATGNNNSDDDTTKQAPTPTPVDTSNVEGAKYLDESDLALTDSTTTILAGASASVGPYMLMNSHATESATVTVKDGVITATGGTVTATGFVMALQDKIEAAMKMEMAEMTGRAAGMFNALTNSPARGEAILGSTKAGVSVEYDGGAMVLIDGGESGWESKAAGMAISGWDGKMLSRGTHSYTVYSNIEAPKRKVFLTYYKPATLGQQAEVKGFESISGTTINYDTVPTTMHGQITFDSDGIEAAGNMGLLDPNGFPQPKAAGAGDNKFDYTGADGKKAMSFKGTFHGASGTYECTSGDCMITAKAPSTTQGPSYTAGTSDTWTFTPDTKNNPEIVEQDADHLHFGWWVNDPKEAGAGGEYLYDAQVFAGGSAMFPAANIPALTGEATYEGPAAGLFAIKADEKNNIAAAHGEFMATATLTADFGVAGNTDEMVSGKIGTFVRSDGVTNDWALTLGKTAIPNTTAASGNGDITDGASVIGKWNYGLYGSGAKSANPTGIAGAFNATITGEDKSVAAVAGAFGATRQ